MDLEAIVEKMKQLEYHQSLLLRMICSSSADFYKLIIEKSLGEEDVNRFFELCDRLSKVYKNQKAEGLLFYHPLYEKFCIELHPNLCSKEVILACISQGLYLPLMTELKKYC